MSPPYDSWKLRAANDDGPLEEPGPTGPDELESLGRRIDELMEFARWVEANAAANEVVREKARAVLGKKSGGR